MLELAQKGDIVVIALSGHGTEIDDEPSFCPMDATTDQPLASMVKIKTVFDAMERSQATFKLMIVDACRNDLSPAKSLPKGVTLLQTINTPPEGVVLLQKRRKEF